LSERNSHPNALILRDTLYFDATMDLMKQFILIASVSASYVFAQGTAPSPDKPKALPPPPSPQEVLAGGPAAAAAETAVAPDQVVLTIGEEKVTAKEFDSYIDGLPEQMRAQARGPLKRQMAEQIVRVKLLSQDAKKNGLDEDPVVKSRIQFQTENLLAGAAYNDMLKNVKVDEPAVQKYFEEHKNEWDEISARHILVKFKGSPVPVREGKQELSEEQALAKVQEIRKRLLAGEDFAAVAKEESDDVGSGANGGDLGTFKRGSMVPEFEAVAFDQPVGEVSEPVKTQFGFHLIKVEKHDSKTLEDVRSQIEDRIKPDMARQAVEALRSKAAVEMNESYFGPAAPAMMPGGAAGPAHASPSQPAKPAAAPKTPGTIKAKPATPAKAPTR
jgi:peptidyl-prolyl cis-trans isomerase C